MRKETATICRLFIDGHAGHGARTTTDGTALYLHGSKIAWKENGRYKLTLAGWPTVTTRERLNGLCELLNTSRPFSQHRGRQYFYELPIGAETIVDVYPAYGPPMPPTDLRGTRDEIGIRSRREA